ncbi:MAG: type II toxin-antitoxin system VapB family antitoxin [Spirochaetales bacterium]|nr:type II toxin-antitoxin system VapB family antitoxin [Spirochaetales bacterium]
MAMSIRNSGVEKQVRDISSRTGYSLTETLEKALETFDASLSAETQSRFSRLASIAASCSSLPDIDARSFDEILGYGDDGAFSL